MTRAIEEALRSDDAEVRRQATMALTTYDGADLEQLLMVALSDESWRVREEAVRVGVELASRVNVIDQLVAAICQGENVGLRNSALALLGALGPRVHGALKRAMDEVERDARKFVLEALARAGGEGVVPILVEHLNCGDPNMVAAALDALAVVGGVDGEAALRGVLKWDDAFQRMAAMDALNRLDAVVPWDELATLLADRLVFRVALPALGRCADARAIGPLVSALSESSPRVVADAAAALAMLVDARPHELQGVAEAAESLSAEARSRLSTLDEHHSIDARQGAAIVLCLAHDVRGLESALQFMATAGGVPASLMAALQLWGEPAADLLLEDFVHGDGTHAPAALELAAVLMSDRGVIVPALVSRLRAELRKGLLGADPELRLVAARCLGPWAEGADAVSLVEAALQQDEELAQACGEALVGLSAREPDPVREALSQVELVGPGLELVVGLIASLEGGKALGRLQALLLSDDVATRCAALTGLAELGDQRAADVIGLALSDPDLEVQLAAAEALGRLPDELGVTTLLLCLDGSPPALCAAVAHSLGETGSARAEGALAGLLRTSIDQPAVQVAALTSLRRLQAPGLRGLLVDALHASDAEVVKQALAGLAELGSEAFTYLADSLGDARWDVRRLAASLVGASGHPEASARLAARLESETDDMVRAGLLEAMRRSNGES